MKKTKNLIKCAEMLAYKYAGFNAEEFRPEIEANIKTALSNASMQNKPQMMLPFVQMIKQDHTTLTFDVTRDDKWGGRKSITVSNFSVVPNENNAYERYLPLATQVKDYIEKNWELYPNQRNGVPLEYHNFTIQCRYSSEDDSSSGAPIAGN